MSYAQDYMAYALLSQDEQEKLQVTADRLRTRIKRTNKAMVEIGNELIVIKKDLGHGRWGHWVRTVLEMEMRTVQRYMKAATPKDETDETDTTNETDKNDNVSHLSGTRQSAKARAASSRVAGDTTASTVESQPAPALATNDQVVTETVETTAETTETVEPSEATEEPTITATPDVTIETIIETKPDDEVKRLFRAIAELAGDQKGEPIPAQAADEIREICWRVMVG